MKLFFMTGIALASLSLASAASADTAQKWYVGGDLGYSWMSDQKVTSSNTTPPNDSHYKYGLSTKDTLAGYARLGYQHSPSVRFEIEGSYRPGDVNKALGPQMNFGSGLKDSGICSVTVAADCGSPSGKIDQFSVMANAFYEFYSEYPMHPFIGAGVGFDYIDAHMTGRLSQVGDIVTIKGQKFAPAAQFLLGTSWQASDRLTLDLTYRLLGVGETTYATTTSGSHNMGNLKGSFTDQTLSVGLRYAFGSARAPAPTPVAPTPMPATPPAATPPVPEALPSTPVTNTPAYAARQFIVYFRWNRSNLTTDALAVVKTAADYANTGNAQKVVIVGYTDTSGSAAYNIKLSARRAKTVATALATQGFDKAKMAVDWKGETDLAVPTKDGVKEPQNRRSTIDVSF